MGEDLVPVNPEPLQCNALDIADALKEIAEDLYGTVLIRTVKGPRSIGAVDLVRLAADYHDKAAPMGPRTMFDPRDAKGPPPQMSACSKCNDVVTLQEISTFPVGLCGVEHLCPKCREKRTKPTEGTDEARKEMRPEHHPADPAAAEVIREAAEKLKGYIREHGGTVDD